MKIFLFYLLPNFIFPSFQPSYNNKTIATNIPTSSQPASQLAEDRDLKNLELSGGCPSREGGRMDPCLVDDGSWTDEKHMHFLDLLETSFLHAMFGASGGAREGECVRLDREMPDSCDSTWDSWRQIPQRSKARLSKGTRRPSSSSSTSRHRVDPSNDQVVPQQLARRWGGEEDDEEEKDHGQKRRRCLDQTQ